MNTISLLLPTFYNCRNRGLNRLSFIGELRTEFEAKAQVLCSIPCKYGSIREYYTLLDPLICMIEFRVNKKRKGKKRNREERKGEGRKKALLCSIWIIIPAQSCQAQPFISYSTRDTNEYL
jgi:hypothetical protein